MIGCGVSCGRGEVGVDEEKALDSHVRVPDAALKESEVHVYSALLRQTASQVSEN